MKFKFFKFVARTFREALAAAQKKLGEDFLVVTAKPFQDISGTGQTDDRVEITVIKPDHAQS